MAKIILLHMRGRPAAHCPLPTSGPVPRQPGPSLYTSELCPLRTPARLWAARPESCSPLRAAACGAPAGWRAEPRGGSLVWKPRVPGAFVSGGVCPPLRAPAAGAEARFKSHFHKPALRAARRPPLACRPAHPAQPGMEPRDAAPGCDRAPCAQPSAFIPGWQRKPARGWTGSHSVCHPLALK